MYNKKADIVLKYLLGTIITIILLFAVFNFVVRFIGLNRTAQGEADFNNLVNIMENIKPNEQKQAYLRLDKNTAIVAFKADASRNFLFTDSWIAGNRLGLPVMFSFNRFELCQKEKACICLVKDFTEITAPFIAAGGDIPDVPYGTFRFYNDDSGPQYDTFLLADAEKKLYMKNAICKSFQESDFANFYLFDEIAYPSDQNKQKIYGFKNGFFFINEYPLDFLKTSYLYISKNNDNEILFCFEKDCPAFYSVISEERFQNLEREAYEKWLEEHKTTEGTQQGGTQGQTGAQSGAGQSTGQSTTQTLSESDKKEAFKTAICKKESTINCYDWMNNIDGDAWGRYQFKASTALGIADTLQSMDVDLGISNIGSLKDTYGEAEGTRMGLELMRANLLKREFSEKIMDYYTTNLYDKFDGNIQLMAMAHYAPENDILEGLEAVYPGINDYSNIDVNEFVRLRSNRKSLVNGVEVPCNPNACTGDDNWLTNPQTTGKNVYISIYDYSKIVAGFYSDQTAIG